MPAVEHRLRRVPAFLRAIEDGLAAGRGLRGRRAQLTRAAIVHALPFPTWRSLALDQGLRTNDAVELVCRLIAGRCRLASRLRPARSLG